MNIQQIELSSGFVDWQNEQATIKFRNMMAKVVETNLAILFRCCASSNDPDVASAFALYAQTKAIVDGLDKRKVEDDAEPE